ncbi:MerR family transcriptional regulator [Chitinophaga japonensis]|uniref:DNA-binding transcriptional MerR regulator n=1 Tax=Chitinophaga japonensis TaxID=104662 RepID=A0A562T3D3_CHIJA|nr:MerR family transcriptional regulator [Chitinophaga japonensis]TWI88079.1 DNA-binding transcriptional MerR regulator [Chitinophaga japonensis]
MKGHYSVKQLARLAGVSVRTLHHYDQLGLLTPRIRTGAGYRLYGEAELLRLQQILFYKELDFSLQEIGDILDDADFDVLQALESHKAALQHRRHRLDALLATIDKTIASLKEGNTMLTIEELYEGFPKDKAETYRQEAMEKYGADTVQASEQQLRRLSRQELDQLKAQGEDLNRQLRAAMQQDPASPAVQALIAVHYAQICTWWGHSNTPCAPAAAYRGLAQLYLSDERYTMQQGQPDPAYAAFLSKAMIHYADTQL